MFNKFPSLLITISHQAKKNISIELEEQQMQLHVAMLCGGKPCYEIELYFDFCKVPILRIVLFDFLKPTELQSVLKQSI